MPLSCRFRVLIFLVYWFGGFGDPRKVRFESTCRARGAHWGQPRFLDGVYRGYRYMLTKSP